MLQKPNISKPKKITNRNLKSKTPPEVSKLLNTIGLDSSSSFSSRSSSSSKNKSGFSSESSNSNSGNQAKGSSQNVTCISYFMIRGIKHNFIFEKSSYVYI